MLKGLAGKLDIYGMPVQSCSAMGIGTFKSTIKHDTLRMGRFAKEPFRKQEEIGYYSDTLTFTSPYGDKDAEKSCSEEVMSASMKKF